MPKIGRMSKTLQGSSIPTRRFTLGSHPLDILIVSFYFDVCEGAVFFALFFFVSAAKPRRGLGPNFLIILANSMTVVWNFWPSAALQKCMDILSGSKPTAFITSRTYSTFRIACLDPVV